MTVEFGPNSLKSFKLKIVRGGDDQLTEPGEVEENRNERCCLDLATPATGNPGQCPIS